MPAKNEDLHGSVPDKSEVALVLIDMINDLEFDEGEKLLQHIQVVAENIAQLKNKPNKQVSLSSTSMITTGVGNLTLISLSPTA